MTTRARVRATARALLAIAIGRAVLFGGAAGLVMASIVTVAADGTVAGVVGATGAVAAAAWSFVRSRGRGFNLPNVALWLEEQVPSLGYALVTALEPGTPAGVERSIAGVDWSGVTHRAGRKALMFPFILVLAATGAYAAASAWAPALTGIRDRAASRSPAIPGVLDVTVEVRPPAYIRRPAESLRNPQVLRALVGSEVRVSVAGVPSFTLAIGGSARPGDVPWRVEPQPVALRVESGSASRLIAVDPIPDSVPVVRLLSPARDTVLATPSGEFTLGATLRDDLGLGRAAFEYIVSSGSGESFTFATGTTGIRQLTGRTESELSGRLSLATLQLKPGDFVHLRAVAFDQRGDSAAGRGVSETRTIRIARAGEYDSVAVEAAAPPEADKAVLSQRMLINMAEALVRRRPRLARPAFSAESRSIALDQARLRRQVGDLVFARLGDDPSGEHFHGDGHQHEGQELRPAMTPDELLKAAENAASAAVGKVLDFEGDETPVVAVNRPLLEAYNHMWDAGRELDQAAPDRALPAMYRALDAIQRARAAERLYLRSRTSRVVVDVERARLQGKEKGTPAAREPRPSLGSSPGPGAARVALARFARLVLLADRDPAAAADSLLLLRIDLLGDLDATAATAAADAAAALRNGRDATMALSSFRRALGGAPAADSLSRWSGVR